MGCYVRDSPSEHPLSTPCRVGSKWRDLQQRDPNLRTPVKNWGASRDPLDLDASWQRCGLPQPRVWRGEEDGDIKNPNQNAG